jgi:hypothetical protein
VSVQMVLVINHVQNTTSNKIHTYTMFVTYKMI